MSTTQPFLGIRLRRIRSDLGHSIAEVADQTGISPSFLSLVENGKSDISIGRLVRLTDFYGLPLADLFPNPPAADIEVIRAGSNARPTEARDGVELATLVAEGGRRLAPVLASFEPGGRVPEPLRYDGEVFVYVVEGAIGVEFEGGHTITLQRGDGAYVRSPGRRAFWNPGREPAQLLAVVARTP